VNSLPELKTRAFVSEQKREMYKLSSS